MDPDLLFARGRDAADRGNYDYAIAVFRDILRVAPDHLNSRIALRGCEVARFQERSPDARMERCEDFLQHLPLSSYGLRKLAAACKAGGHLDAAVNTLEFLRQRRPNKPGVLRMLGELYAEKEDYARAVRCYEELSRLKPSDRFIQDRLRNLSAAEHLHHTRLAETKSYRETIRDEDRAKQLEEEQHIIRTADEADAAIARYQAKLKENPSDIEALQKLGDLYQIKEQYNFAMAAYKKALEIEPRYDVRVRIGDLKIKLLKREEDTAVAAAKADPTNAALSQKAQEARKRRLETAIEEHEARLREHPTEIPLAHKLGMLYWEEGSDESIAKAITLFQRSVEDPKFKPRARFMLGQCFARDPKTHDMAIIQFEQALELILSPTSDTAKAIQYNLGRLHEESGNRAKALEWYKKVFTVDAAYRDVRQKIDELS